MRHCTSPPTHFITEQSEDTEDFAGRQDGSNDQYGSSRTFASLSQHPIAETGEYEPNVLHHVIAKGMQSAPLNVVVAATGHQGKIRLDAQDSVFRLGLSCVGSENAMGAEGIEPPTSWV